MLSTYEAILILLKSFIQNEPPVLPDQPDFKELYSVSKEQHIDGILGFIISNYNLVPDQTIAQKFLDSYISSLTINTNQTLKFEKLAKHLVQNNIALTVFKGYCVRKIYPIPELRSFSDVDILIKEHDRKKSHTLMLDSGFKCNVEYGNVYNYKKGIEYYELHTSLLGSDILEEKNINNYLNTAWEHTVKTGNGIYEFEDEFHLIYLIAHIAKHIYYGGAGIRMYLDIALFVNNKPSFDYYHFIKTAEELGIGKFSCTVIKAACSWFSIDVPSYIKDKHEIDSETLYNLYLFTIDKGIYGNAMSSSGEATVQLMKKQGSKHPKFDAFLSVTFPKLKTMKLRYGYLEKAPYLLPIAWAHRVLTNLGSIKSKKRKVKDIMSTDNNIVIKHQSMLNNIGL